MSLDYSIIIPAYNAAEFLKRAVDSIRSQDYDSWEIIIVENGSTDNTYEIAEELSCDKIHVTRSEKGVSNARNMGIENAQGNWIVFLDADDKLVPGALTLMSKDISEAHSLISYRYKHNTCQSAERSFKGDEIAAYLVECLNDPTQRGNSTAVLFNREFVVRNSIRFDSSLTHAEDSLFLMNCIVKASSIKDCDEPIYEVITNNDSAVRSISDDAINSYCDAIRLVGSALENQSSQVINAYRVFAISQLLVILVNGVYRAERFPDAIKKTKILCRREVFASAIAEVSTSGLQLSRIVTIGLMKARMYMLVGVIIRLRIRQKSSGK